MALQQLPTELIEDNIILEQLPLDEIFTFCQANNNTQYWANRCQNASFWQRIGKSKYPLLSGALQRGIKTSLGKFYHDLAAFMAMLKLYLQDEDFFGITFSDIPLNDPRFFS